MITVLREISDLIGQLIRRYHGADTWRNVVAQARAYLDEA